MATHFGSRCFHVNQASLMILNKLVELNEERKPGRRLQRYHERDRVYGLRERKSGQMATIEPVHWTSGHLHSGSSPLERQLFNTPPPPMTTEIVLQPSSCQLPGGRTYFLQVSTFLCQKLELVAIETALYRRGGGGRGDFSAALLDLGECFVCMRACVCMCVFVW